MGGRPRTKKTYIVDPTEILDDSTIRSEIWRMVDMGKVTVDTITTMEWLARHSLLKNTMQCNNCKEACTLITYSLGIDGKRWACHSCGVRKSIRDGSFFTRSRLPLSKIVILMYCFAAEFTIVYSKHESDSNEKTIIEWFNFLRGDISVFLERHPPRIGGLEDSGEPIIVEVGETHIIHKNGTGCQGHWIFCGVEISSGKCFLVEVPNRNASTLENVIIERVLPGTHIVTSEWEGYKNLGRIADHIYLHTVERDVIDSNFHAHGHTMENLFFRARKRLNTHCESNNVGALFLSFLNEFQFRCNIQRINVFNEILIILKEQYPVENI